MTGAALVCEDLSHVEMTFPFADRENVAFCRPDLSDLPSAVEELVRDEDGRRRIAQEGRRTYTTWTARWREHLLRRHLAAPPGGAELVPAVGSTNGCAGALVSASRFLNARWRPRSRSAHPIDHLRVLSHLPMNMAKAFDAR